MSKTFGENSRIEFAEGLDSDGEMEVSVPLFASDALEYNTWLSRMGAIELIAHLQSVFELDKEKPDPKTRL